MKKNILIISALILFASACGRKVDYQYVQFASLESTSYSFEEDVVEFKVPVVLYNESDAEVQVSFTTKDGKAVEGVDYEVISPVSGILTFAPGETRQEIVLGITEMPDVLTGTKDFTIAIQSATDGLSVSGSNQALLRIKDLDHPLKAFIGQWSASATGYSGTSYSWTVTVDGDESDPTYKNLIVYDLEPMSAKYYGMTSEDGYNIIDAYSSADKTSLIVPLDSFIGAYEESGTSYDLSVRGVNATTLEEASGYTDIEMVLSNDGQKMTIHNAWGLMGPDGLWEVIPGGVVLTKK